MKLGFDESLLKEAFDIRAKAFCETLPSEEEYEKITFSPEFEKRMEKLLKQEQTFYYYWFNTIGKRVASVILIVVIGLLTTTFSVKALRDPFLKFVVEVFEKFTDIFLDDENINDDFIFESVKPEYIPAGYVLQSEESKETFVRVEYQDERKNTIIYTQKKNFGFGMTVNTENTTSEEIIINELNGFIYKNMGMTKIVFANEQYVFSVSGAISTEELIKIAESVPIK